MYKRMGLAAAQNYVPQGIVKLAEVIPVGALL